MVAAKNSNIAMEKTLQWINILIISLFTTSCFHSYKPDDIEVSNEGITILKKNLTPLNGYIRTYYENGIQQSVKEYHNGLLNGYYLRFYPNGALSLKTIHKNGSPIKGYVQYYENGTIKAKRIDSADYQTIYRYYKDGNIFMKQELRNLLLNGKSIQYFKNGSIFVETNYKNDKKNGRFIMYHKNEKINAKAFFINDSIDGSLKSWDDKGQLLTEEYYKRGKNIGTWKYYYPNGVIRVQIKFNENGTVKEKIEYSEEGHIIDKFSTE